MKHLRSILALLILALLLPLTVLPQSAGLLPVPQMQFFDNSGNPLASGKVYTYAAGTSTPLSSYTSSTAGVANANPVILDSAGRAAIWLSSAAYKIVLKTSADVTIWTVDNVLAGGNISINWTRNVAGYLYPTTTTDKVAIGSSSSPTNALDVTGSVSLTGRLKMPLGADVSSAGDLTLGTDGNTFTITGNTTINAITTANWGSGARITLIFTSTPTVKNNTAGSGGTAKMLLAGAVDFSATANDTLSLVYNGTSWFETGRSVN